MSGFRAPPSPLPSLRNIEAEALMLPRRGAAPCSFETYLFLVASEPFIYEELREEKQARERALGAPMPAFESLSAHRLPIPQDGTPVLE